MVDMVAEHVAAIRTKELSIEGPVAEFRQKADAVTPDELKGTFSRIVLAVKAQHTADACHILLPHLVEDGFVPSAQNGLNKLVISSIVGPERTEADAQLGIICALGREAGIETPVLARLVDLIHGIEEGTLRQAPETFAMLADTAAMR